MAVAAKGIAHSAAVFTGNENTHQLSAANAQITVQIIGSSWCLGMPLYLRLTAVMARSMQSRPLPSDATRCGYSTRSRISSLRDMPWAAASMFSLLRSSGVASNSMRLRLLIRNQKIQG